MNNNFKWYKKPTPIVLFLIFFFPVGLYLMWKHSTWSKTTKWIISGAFAFICIINIGNENSIQETNFSPNSSDKLQPEMNCNSSYNENLVRERFLNLSKDIYGISLGHKNKYGIGECEFVFIVNGFDNTRNRGYVCTVKTVNGVIVDTACELTKY